MQKINLADKFALFDDLWTPKIVGELNGQFIKLAKLQGRFAWHSHPTEEEFFYVVKGALTIHLRDEVVELAEGEGFIVPRGIEHCPEASEVAHVMLFEPIETAHTGPVTDALTVAIDDQQRI